MFEHLGQKAAMVQNQTAAANAGKTHTAAMGKAGKHRSIAAASRVTESRTVETRRRHRPLTIVESPFLAEGWPVVERG